MTRKEAEKAIYEKLLEVRKIFEEFCPEDNYLSMAILTKSDCYPDGITFNNSFYRDEDVYNPHRLYFPEHFWLNATDGYEPDKEED